MNENMRSHLTHCHFFQFYPFSCKFHNFILYGRIKFGHNFIILVSIGRQLCLFRFLVIVTTAAMCEEGHKRVQAMRVQMSQQQPESRLRTCSEWYCWVMRQFPPQLSEKSPHRFLQLLHQFSLPPKCIMARPSAHPHQHGLSLLFLATAVLTGLRRSLKSFQLPFRQRTRMLHTSNNIYSPFVFLLSVQFHD